MMLNANMIGHIHTLDGQPRAICARTSAVTPQTDNLDCARKGPVAVPAPFRCTARYAGVRVAGEVITTPTQ